MSDVDDDKINTLLCVVLQSSITNFCPTVPLFNENGTSVWGPSLPCCVWSTQSDNNLPQWAGSDIRVWHWKSGRDHYQGPESRPLASLPLKWIMDRLSRGPSVRDLSLWKMKGSLHSPMSRPWRCPQQTTHEQRHTFHQRERWEQWDDRVWVRLCVCRRRVCFWPDPLNTLPPSPAIHISPFFLASGRPWDCSDHFLAPFWQKCNQAPLSSLRVQYKWFIEHGYSLNRFSAVEQKNKNDADY